MRGEVERSEGEGARRESEPRGNAPSPAERPPHPNLLPAAGRGSSGDEHRHADIARTLDEALAPITDGCMLAVPRETSGVRDGGDAGADPARRQAPASRHAADLDLAGGSADRRRLHRDAGNLRRQPRRIRPGAALHRRDPRRRDPHARRHLPGAACAVPGRRERRAVHAAARAHRLRRAGAPAGLESRRQSVRQ